MSDIHGLIQQPPGYYFISLEESYVVMFEASAKRQFEASAKTGTDEKRRDTRHAHAVAKAYISSVLVQLSNLIYKLTGSEEDIWVFLSFPSLEQRLHGAYKMRALKDAMKELIEDGYVFKRPNSDPHFKALEYRINLEQYRQGLSALPKKPGGKQSANLHRTPDQRADLHGDSAKTHDEGANLHDDEGKNAPSHRADSHARINHIESTERFNSEQQRESDITDAATPDEYTLATANDALALLVSLFHLSTEEARKVLQVALELQQQHVKPDIPGGENRTPSTRTPTSEVTQLSKETGDEVSEQKEVKQAKDKVGSKETHTRHNTGEPPKPSAVALVVLDAWDHVTGKKMPRIRGNVDAAEELAKVAATEDELKNVRDRLLAQTDKGQEVSWWESRGVRLKDVAEHFDLAALGPLPAKDSGKPSDQHRNASHSLEPTSSTDSPAGSGGQKRKPLRLISDAAPKPKEARAKIA